MLAGSDRAAMTTSALRMLFSLAWVGGPPIAALIQSTGGFSALYATAAGMYAVAAIVVLAMLPEPTATAANPVAEADPTPAATRYQSARIIGGTIAAFALVQGAGSVAVQMLPLYLTADLHSGVRQAGLILGLCAALEIPLMLACGALSLCIPLRRLILLGPVFGVAYLVLASTATHSWVLFAGQLLNAACISIMHGWGVARRPNRSPPEHRPRAAR